MAIVRWRPMRDMVSIQDEMNRLFDRFFSRDLMDGEEYLQTSQWSPSMDISENKDEFVVSAELPGMSKNDIQVTFVDGSLKIEGERHKEKEDKNVNYHRVERVHGKFCRSFQLPTAIQQNKISAEFKDGILTIRLPKAEETRPKAIDVKVS
jgi:HSP20 family protein